MTVRLILDSVLHADGTSAVKIIITDKGKVSRIATDINIRPKQWDKRRSKVINHPQAKRVNDILTEKLCDARLAAIEGQKTASDITPRELRREIQPTEDIRPTLDQMLKTLSEDQRYAEHTRELYSQTYEKVLRFKRYKGYGRLVWEDIKPGWLDAFDLWMTKSGMKGINTRSIHLRNIRSAFNRARRDELTMYYPFLMFRIKTEKTRKRSIATDNLRALLTGPAAPWTVKYQKYAQLIICLRGINVKDLCMLKPSDLEGDYLEYKRAKGGRLYRIKIEPEARAIIEEFRSTGSKYLLSIMDDFSSYRSFNGKLNAAMKKIGPWKYIARGQKIEYNPVTENSSSYWLRHSWATTAAELEIPKETISEALGHEIGSDITSIYINFNQKKVDDANRRIIDYLLHACHGEAAEILTESTLDSTDS